MAATHRLAPVALLGGIASSCALIGGLGDYHLAAEATSGDGGPDGVLRDGSGGGGDAPPPIVLPDGAVVLPSCRDLGPICGKDADRDCCASLPVPGGVFNRSFDGLTGEGFDDPGFPATVSGFRLDAFEITVGRFRRFVDAYPTSKPRDGGGKHPRNAADPGWLPAWSAILPPTRDALVASVKCDPKTTWTDVPGDTEANPITCISYYTAFAFCIWDGGRLATEAEWNYAAAGGAEHRVYPWSMPSTDKTLDPAHVVRGVATSARVGSVSPLGDGRWGQSDLAGNVWEWTRDAVAPYVTPCIDCIAGLGNEDIRSARGGCFGCLERDLRNGQRGSAQVNSASRADRGGRCARD